MFKKELEAKLAEIFGFPATHNAFSESFEQKKIFIEINEVHSRITQGRAYAKVEGAIVVFSQHEALPFGYFNKKIQAAKPATTKLFFFSDVDQDIASSPARLMNLSERRTKFLYLYSAEYDTKHGDLTSLEV